MKNNCKFKFSQIKYWALATFALLLTATSVWSHGMDEGHVEQIAHAGPLDFILIGAVHMVTGYDHILFLVGVIFFLTTVKDIVKFITLFTLGHSITLIGATFMGLQINYYLIDAVIGFSVLYKGFENLGGFQKFFKTSSPNLLLMVFLFGLIHGLGLSTRLQTLSIGDSLSLVNIVSFNIGVELGQIGALIPILFLINLLRKTGAFSYFEKIANGFLVLAGAALIVFQLQGYFENPIQVISPEPVDKIVDEQPADSHHHGEHRHDHQKQDSDGHSHEHRGHTHDGSSHHTH